jgi:hypothetical protein
MAIPVPSNSPSSSNSDQRTNNCRRSNSINPDRFSLQLWRTLAVAKDYWVIVRLTAITVNVQEQLGKMRRLISAEVVADGPR